MTRSARRAPAWLAYAALVLALVVAAGGGATAGALITGKQIKDGSVTTKDIRDGTLKLDDVRPDAREQLVGAPGQDGADGADGASAYAPPPSGTLVTGSGIYYERALAAAESQRAYVSLGFLLGADLRDSGEAKNLYAGPTTILPFDVNLTACPGTFENPLATAGDLCLYLAPGATNATEDSGFLFPGIGVNSAGRRTGFLIAFTATSPGLVNLRYTWAYQAP